MVASALLPIFYVFLFFFFNDTATTEIYTLSLHDALPIFVRECAPGERGSLVASGAALAPGFVDQDRKSTRLNSSHVEISYAVFCLKKKKKTKIQHLIKNKKKNKKIDK